MFIFATQDPERALGLQKDISSFAIACIKRDDIASQLERDLPNFFCLGDHVDVSKILTTHDLLAHSKTQEFIQEVSKNILVFKNIPKIQKLADKQGWQLLNNDPKFNKTFEDKIEFSKTCDQLGLRTPKTIITCIKDADYSKLTKELGKKLVAQFRRGHAGDSTHFINSKSDWQKLAEAKSDYPAKITQFITGPTLTYNICIGKKKIRYSNLMQQINAYPDFSSHPGGTCGVDIQAAKKYEKREFAIKKELDKLAANLQEQGYKGLFGVDFILHYGKMFLIECNPRLTSNLPLNNQIEAPSLLASHVQAFLPSVKLNPGKPSKHAACFILRNNTSKSFTIKAATESDEYTISGEKFTLYAKPVGSLINPNMKYATVISKNTVLTKSAQPKQFLRKLREQFKFKEVLISPQNFWQNVYGKPKKELIDVFVKPLKNLTALSDAARNRNRQTQCRKDEGAFQLLGEYEDYFLIKKWDGTYGWVAKKEVSKTTEGDAETPKSDITKFLKTYLGVKYLWGGISKKGIDCSGLTQRYMLQIFGIQLPKHSLDQMKKGSEIKQKDLQDHDLIFLRQKSKGQSHVGVFLNGQVLHASLSQKVVVQQELKEMLEEYELVGIRRHL